MTVSSLENNPPTVLVVLLLTFVTAGGVGEDAVDPSLTDVVVVVEEVDDTMKEGEVFLGSASSFMGIVPFFDVPHM